MTVKLKSSLEQLIELMTTNNKNQPIFSFPKSFK